MISNLNEAVGGKIKNEAEYSILYDPGRTCDLVRLPLQQPYYPGVPDDPEPTTSVLH